MEIEISVSAWVTGRKIIPYLNRFPKFFLSDGNNLQALWVDEELVMILDNSRTIAAASGRSLGFACQQRSSNSVTKCNDACGVEDVDEWCWWWLWLLRTGSRDGRRPPCATFWIYSSWERVGKGASPLSICQRMMPKLKMSTFSLYGQLRASSGAMYFRERIMDLLYESEMLVLFGIQDIHPKSKSFNLSPTEKPIMEGLISLYYIFVI